MRSSVMTAVAIVAIAFLAVALYATRSPQPVATPLPTPTATVTAPTTPSPTPSLSPTPSPSPSPSATPSPTPTLAPSCQPVGGGRAGGLPQLTGLAVAHQPGADRLTFTFDAAAVPQYRIQQTKELVGTSGQPVKVEGNAILELNFQNASTVRPDTGAPTYTGPTDIRPATPLVKEVRLVEDFERVMVWGAGLDHLVCPLVREEAVPGSSTSVRLIVDLPSPP